MRIDEIEGLDQLMVQHQEQLEGGISMRLIAKTRSVLTMRWREGDLLNLSKVVLNIFIQCELSERPQWDLALWPDLGQIEDVPSELFGLFR